MKNCPDQDGVKFRWQLIATWIGNQIDSGSLRHGEKLPSVRKLADQFDMSLTTVQRAIWYLEETGRIQSKSRVGSVVVANNNQDGAFDFSGLTVNVDMEVANMLAQASQPNKKTLGSAVLSKALSADAYLRRCLKSVAANSESVSEFVPPPGNKSLRQFICGQMVSRGIICSPEDIIITAGDTVAMELGLMAVQQPNGLVVVEDPTYFGILQAIQHTGMRALPIKTHSDSGLDLDELEQVICKLDIAAIFLNPTLQNPLGFVMPLENRKLLCDLARENNIPIIEDDVFYDLLMPDDRVDALKALGEENVIYCSSVTKSIAPGFRVGWCIPGKFKSSILAQMFGRNLSVSSIPQEILVDFYRKGYLRGHLEDLRTKIKNSSAKFKALIAQHFPQGTVYRPPEVGFVHWIELPKTIMLEQFRQSVEQADIVLPPAEVFSLTGKSKYGLRFCLTAPMSGIVEDCIKQVGELAKAHI